MVAFNRTSSSGRGRRPLSGSTSSDRILLIKFGEKCLKDETSGYLRRGSGEFVTHEELSTGMYNWEPRCKTFWLPLSVVDRTQTSNKLRRE